MIPTEPPATAPLLPLDRRSLIKGGILGAGLAAAPLSAQVGQRGFSHGVASGEPGARRVLLWTRYVAAQETALTCELSESLDFARPIAGGQTPASPDRDFCAKLFVEGLEPGRWYYYRFIAPDGAVSDIGRTKTLSEGETGRFRMAVFSCSNIGFGWFNAYAHAAQADDVDCVLHLGDYFYEYAPGTYPSAGDVTPGRTVWPERELVALADYRARFAAYRRDADLRRLHQLFPMIAVADDHESANDSWAGGAQNHQPDSEGPWDVRKAAAIRAYREWMPVSDEPWAEYEIGNLATLFRLETRLTARSEQFSFDDLLAGKTTSEAAQAALIAFRDETYRDPAREMLGAAQQGWLANGLKRSRGDGKIWQVLVQQVLMGSLSSPPGVDALLPKDTPDFIRKRVVAGARAAETGLPLNMDAWDGYPAARERLFAAALAADANLISLAGDTHNAWAFDLSHDSAPVGVEFGGQSVSSPGFEGYLPMLPPPVLTGALVQRNPQLRWADTSQRGYMAVELTPQRASSEYRFVSSVRTRGADLAGTKTLTTLTGRRTLALGAETGS
ncbi:alkaline phosphatase D family protein [Qipengyuania marisflavi]|uniref:Alkaline phosphatase n=1 Tax=Qipengyuania marisflavi TaxID=2486356 RepID=A0A5S3PB96_9SPHN|nr:alkaline phosphatase D family protein [Qipengyuania marisflavi]TMM48318.1 alkaline phosphatase [Qipengyuania marisflavi]